MKLKELITDPSSQQLSMSRLCLPAVLAIDLMWVVFVCLRWPPDDSFGAVSSMLGIITGAVAGIYGLSTMKSTGIVDTVTESVSKIFKKAE